MFCLGHNNIVPHKNLGRSKERPMASTGRSGRRRGLDAILHQGLENEMIQQNRRAKAERKVNNIVGKIIKHLKSIRTSTFAKQAERLNVGRYHETLRVSV